MQIPQAAPWEMQIWLKEQYQDSIVPDYEQKWSLDLSDYTDWSQ